MRKRKGFSLFEMVLVLAISGIGLLAGNAILGFVSNMNATRSELINSNLDQQIRTITGMMREGTLQNIGTGEFTINTKYYNSAGEEIKITYTPPTIKAKDEVLIDGISTATVKFYDFNKKETLDKAKAKSVRIEITYTGASGAEKKKVIESRFHGA